MGMMMKKLETLLYIVIFVVFIYYDLSVIDWFAFIKKYFFFDAKMSFGKRSGKKNYK
jgi:hypothetical protein